MKIRCLLLSFAMLLMSAFMPIYGSFNATAAASASSGSSDSTTTDSTHPGFRVEGRFLYDNQGQKVILYGVNKMCIWTDKTGQSFSEIAKTGANCVRITWGIDGTAAELDTVIRNCRAAHMIPIVELHDATGEWSKLSSLVDYWTRDDVLQVIKKHEQYLLINIGNEVGNEVSEDDFKTGYKDAVTRMRTAGIHVPLIIDGCNWGQNIDILQSCGPYLIENDPDKNLMFSVHMWWPYEYGYTDETVVNELAESASMNLPLIVGEFGNKWDETSQGKIPYKVIMENCYKNQIGYIAWEWGPGNNPQTWLDMTSDSTYATLQDWGLEVAVTDRYSIQNIAERPVSMLTNLSPVLPEEPMPAGNLALGKTAVASSAEDTAYTADNVTDGNFSTRWSSEYSDPNWVYVDLGSKKDISRVIIRWEAAYATQYKIQVSDDAENWTDVYTNYNGVGGTDDISLTGSGRYVRMYGTQRTNSSWGYSIYEIGVYGPESAQSASVSPTVATFDQNPDNQADLSLTLTSNGNTLKNIICGGTALTADTDYSVSGDTLTIKKEYLASLSEGTHRFTLDYDGGVDPVIDIAVGDTSPCAYITPSRADFNKNVDYQKDISVTMTPGNRTFTGITSGSDTLVKGTDYTVDGNTVTIKKEYLAQQSVGIDKLAFNFDKGSSPLLRINISDTSPTSTITPSSASFEKRQPADVSVSMELNGNTLVGIKNGSEALTEGTDYTVDENSVTISRDYLANQSVGTTSLTFDFSAGIDPVLNITVTDTPPTSTISPVTTIFNSKSPADVNVTMTLNGNTLSSIYNGSDILTEGTDYTVDGNTVTILKEYLESQSAGTIKLTFKFSEGKDQTLTITPPTVIKVESYNSSTVASTNTIAPKIKLTNTGTESINLSDVKLRYYFTSDGAESQNFWCDWSTAGSSNVTGTFVTMSSPTETADTYLEIGFTSDAGTIAPNQSVEVQMRVAKNDWSNYDQSNDYSFDSVNTNYGTFDKITSYISGVLNSGTEP